MLMRIYTLLFFLVFSFHNIFSQNTDENQISGTLNLSSDDVDFELELNQKSILNDTNWFYSFKDNFLYSKPNITLGDWKSVEFPIELNTIKEINFKGIAWFRNTFTIDSSLINKNLNLFIQQTGASEIYIDGKLIQQFGKVAYLYTDEILRNPVNLPINVRFDKTGKHSIAIRYSNFYGTKYINHFDDVYVWLHVYLNSEPTYNKRIGTNSLKTFYKIVMGMLIGSFFILSLINIIFYLFYKKDKGNLFFSIFSFTMMLMFSSPFITDIFPNPKIYFINDYINLIAAVISTIFLMQLIFYFNYDQKPKRFYVYLIISIVTLLIAFFDYNLGNQIGVLSYIIIYSDLIISSIIIFLKNYDQQKRKRKFTLYILISLIVFAVIMLFFNPFISLVIIGLIALAFILPIAGFTFIVPVYMIIKQAKSFATLNKELENKLNEVQALSEKTIAQEIEKQQILENQNKLLEDQVKQRTIELSHKNQEITDSIQYASRIQKALLVNNTEIEKGLANQFILFKPKDIVSGDFYFYAQEKQFIFLAAADCTGHGVPGSLMSMIGHEKLKLAITHSVQPGKILSLLNTSIKDALKQNEQLNATRDGMDIALVRIDVQTNEVIYSGANRPIWIIRKVNNEIEEIKATKKAIGGFTETNQVFEEHLLKFNKDDSFYLFSDGYADQFGQNGKKLMTKKFKEILLSIVHFNTNEQKDYLNEFIENWRSGIEQIDDILVIGVRL